MGDGAAATGLRVCWVTDDWDASYRYRCRHGVQQLRAAGVPANVYHLHDPALVAAIPAYSVVVLFRLRWSSAVGTVVDAARASGARLVFEVDDLIFDPSVEPLLHFLADLPAASRREYHERFARLRRTFDACDVFLGTTPALARLATALGKEALVHPNLLPPEYEATARVLMRLRPRSRTAIAYGAGSNTHDRDLAAVSPALAAVLARRPERRLYLGGFVELPGALRPVAAQVVRIPYQDWRVYPWTLARCAVAVAPVAERNAFTDGKSALKFFEAGILGVPLVASPVEAFRDAITPGVDGFLADGEDAWVDALERALDPIEGAAVGRRARETVLRHHSFAAYAGRLAALLAPLAGRATGPEPAPLSLEPEERGARRPPAPGPAARMRLAWAFLQGHVPAAPVGAPGAAVVEPVDPGPVEALLAALDAHGAAWLRDGPGAVAELVPDARGWAAWTPQGLAGEAGHFTAAGDDPSLAGPPTAIETAAWRWLVLRVGLRTADGRGTVQLFWDTGGGITEAASLRVPVEADGVVRTLVVDLGETAWPSAGVVRRLRLDPLDAPGTIELGRCVLLPDAAACDPAGIAAGLAARHARGAGGDAGHDTAPGSLAWTRATVDDAGEDALQARLAAPVAALAPDGVLLLSGRVDATALRFALARVGPALGIVLRELGVAADGVVHAALRRTGRPPEPARARVHPIDVVVPIHNARAETIACLESVLAHATGDWRLVPVDDASTDPVLVAWLDELAAREPRVELLRNARNRGFVGTANRGLRAAGERDVVLLNSDTVATPGFLDGLEAAAYAGGRPALVSPLSNNATILSVPIWCRPNPLPPGWELDGFAALVRDASPRLRPELPTAHGFCMYVPAAVREAVGLFDEETFGRGFGEENDLCERARAAGFPSRCADDVLVWHAGHASFGAETADELTRAHFAALHARHPEYLPRVAAFVEQNPLAPVQESVQLALRRPHADTPALLCILHASFDTPAGGTEWHVRDMVAALRLPRVVVAAPAWDAIAITEVFDGDLDGAVRYRLPLAEPSRRFQLARADVTRAVREIVRLFGIGAAHLHQLCGWPVAIWRELHDLGVPFVATFQDFYPVCPNVNLWDAPSDELCCIAPAGEGPDPVACLRHAFAVFGQEVADPLAWQRAHRAEFRELLAHAERVFFPAQRTHDIIARFQPADPARWVVEPHGYLEPTRRATPDARRRPLNIALLGEIAYPIKGARHYEPLIERTRDLPLAWHVFGEAERFGFADRLRALGLGSRLHLHGRYHRDDICELFAEADIDLVVFLPPWPETFSYTLSEALIAGVPVVVTDQGALTERVHASGAGIVVRDVDEAVAALTRLIEEEGVLATLIDAAQRFRHRSLPEMAAAYAPTYRDLLARGPRPHVLDADDRRRLVALHREPAVAPPAPAAVALPPAMPHYERAWYRHYVRVAGLVPPAVRRWARERVAARWWRTVRALPFGKASTPVSPNDGLELVTRARGSAAYRVLHDDPAFVFTAGPFRARDVRVIRFAMRCEARGDLFAQVFWSHGVGEAFSEDKSLRIPIVAGDGRWHDYTVVIDQSDRKAVWDAGEEIVHLRFDPLNAPGLVELGAFSLCAPGDAADQRDGARP